MKKALLLFVMSAMMTGSLFARVDRFKTDVDADKTKNHVTYELPLYFTEDHTNLLGTYTLATNVGGKKSGTLSFDFRETENEFSKDIRMKMLYIAKDIHENSNPRVAIKFKLNSGEEFTFDGTYFQDWTKSEWNQLIHVTYNVETKTYRTYIMFPLEYMKSSVRDLTGNTGNRYKYMLKAISNHDIVQIQVIGESEGKRVVIDIPIDRPTAETLDAMCKK